MLATIQRCQGTVPRGVRELSPTGGLVAVPLAELFRRPTALPGFPLAYRIARAPSPRDIDHSARGTAPDSCPERLVSFGDAVQSVLRQYATFRGRAGRPEFWWWYLCTVLINIATTGVDEVTDATIGVSFVGTIVTLGLLLPTLAVSVRRLHDSGLTGWWLLAPIGLVILGFGSFIGGFAAIIVPAFLGNAPGSVGLSTALFAAGALLLLAGAVLSLVLMLRRSTPGPNRFGPYPGTPTPTSPPGSSGYPSPYAGTWPPATDAAGGRTARPPADGDKPRRRHGPW